MFWNYYPEHIYRVNLFSSFMFREVKRSVILLCYQCKNIHKQAVQLPQFQSRFSGLHPESRLTPSRDANFPAFLAKQQDLYTNTGMWKTCTCAHLYSLLPLNCTMRRIKPLRIKGPGLYMSHSRWGFSSAWPVWTETRVITNIIM